MTRQSHCGRRSTRRGAILCLVVLPVIAQADESKLTGPETEQRFPPLVLPEGFRATLFACDPLVEYPSVIALGPQPGTLFVAHDYVTGLGVEIVRRDEIRLLQDLNGDGYADRSTLYADGFNSIQGLEFHGGSVYVMHAPRLTRLTDTDGDGDADERQDLLAGLGLPPEENDNRLHCANGIVYGHDGWLYLALGDRGCDVERPEGDRLVFREGGILRCRTDGSDLHVFSHGLRNIYDIALDAELNVFIRDNENDGGDYMIRVCHCFHGSDHGYPYLYSERPEEALRPLADLGRGSSAGGTAYRETAFPREFRRSLYFCEWGRAVVRYPLAPGGSGFADVTEVDFAAGAADDPYGFKPTDLVVDRDGSLLISDWADGQRPRRGRGRIYRVAPASHESRPVAADFPPDTPLAALLQALDSDSYLVRVAAQEAIERHGAAGFAAVTSGSQLGPDGRSHGVWALAHTGGVTAIETLLNMAAVDPDERVRIQAVRALADLTDPVFVSRRLEGGRGDADVCRRLAALAEDAAPPLQREILIALGRLGWADAPRWLRDHWTGGDAALAHAAMILLRRAGHWPVVVSLLDAADSDAAGEPSVRTLALRALADCTDVSVVDALCARLKSETNPQRRRELIDLLSRVARRPAEWTYWGFRPAPRQANPVDWEKTEQIIAVLIGALQDEDSYVRTFAGRRMLREDISIPVETLSDWLEREPSSDGTAIILDALRRHPAESGRNLLQEIVCDRARAVENRIAALSQWVAGLDADSEPRLTALTALLEEGPVLVAALQECRRRPNVDARELMVQHLKSPMEDVRAAAVAGLAERPAPAARPQVVRLLQDRDARVRRGAATLAGALQMEAAADRLLSLANDDEDALVRAAGLSSLLSLNDPRGRDAAVNSLAHPDCQIAALRYLARYGTFAELEAVMNIAQSSRAVDVLAAAVELLTAWQERLVPQSSEHIVLEESIARIHGLCGIPFQWRIAGPMTEQTESQLFDRDPPRGRPVAAGVQAVEMRRIGIDPDTLSVSVPRVEGGVGKYVWIATTHLLASTQEDVEMLAAGDGELAVWLNDRPVQFPKGADASSPTATRSDVALDAGINRVHVRLASIDPDVRFSLHFRRRSSAAAHERLARQALGNAGNVERGSALFHNEERTQCLKCHRLGDRGGRIGPDLTGVGRRFSRIHLIEAILEPSRTIAPSYETHAVVLRDGRVIAGVKVAETAEGFMLGDSQGKLHKLHRTEIDEQQIQSKSAMPDGFEKVLSEAEFVDLIAFLAAQSGSATAPTIPIPSRSPP